MSSSEADTTSRSEHVLVIKPGRADKQYWSDLWTYRELFLILAWRDVAVQYKQTAFGVAWAVVRPLLTMLIFTFVFGRVAELPSEGEAPYSLMVFAGMLAWFLFSTILNQASNSLTSNANLVGKIYFPRLILPVASSVVALVDLLISLVLFALIMLFSGYFPDSRVVLLPFFILLVVLAAIGPALFLASLNVRYRDFRIIVPFIVQFGLYVSPVGFSSSVVPEEWRLLYSVNPVVGAIDGFRWCLLRGEADLYLPSVVLSAVTSALLLLIGLRTFRSTEKTFADTI